MDFVEEGTQRSKHTPTFGYSVTGEDPVVLSISGEVDLATARDLSAVLDDLTLWNRSLVLDLGDVEFMDSTGIHVIEKVTADLQKTGGRLEISSVSDPVRRVFELSGMDRVLPLPSAGDPSEG
ncbi:MAG TPA: STAS domain-containing protein [Acidimicrobiales bacterium]|nr:STAS domain-containing protein [Acidimicrobiales bacterium]